MILVVSATELELQPLLDTVPADNQHWTALVSGVGAVETTLSLTRFLEQRKGEFDTVLHFGIAGAYIPPSGQGAELLDICLAGEEIFGDFGICHTDHIEALSADFVHRKRYPLDTKLLRRCKDMLHRKNISHRQGAFVTVAGCSATLQRGQMLQRQYNALCENMEGAAVARVCDEFSLPLLELRCISNYVEGRDCSSWKIKEACQRAAACTASFLEEEFLQK